MTPSYCTGISHPANGTIRAPARTWRSYSGVRRRVALTPRQYRGRAPGIPHARTPYGGSGTADESPPRARSNHRRPPTGRSPRERARTDERPAVRIVARRHRGHHRLRRGPGSREALLLRRLPPSRPLRGQRLGGVPVRRDDAQPARRPGGTGSRRAGPGCVTGRGRPIPVHACRRRRGRHLRSARGPWRGVAERAGRPAVGYPHGELPRPGWPHLGDRALAAPNPAAPARSEGSVSRGGSSGRRSRCPPRGDAGRSSGRRSLTSRSSPPAPHACGVDVRRRNRWR